MGGLLSHGGSSAFHLYCNRIDVPRQAPIFPDLCSAFHQTTICSGLFLSTPEKKSGGGGKGANGAGCTRARPLPETGGRHTLSRGSMANLPIGRNQPPGAKPARPQARNTTRGGAKRPSRRATAEREPAQRPPEWRRPGEPERGGGPGASEPRSRRQGPA